MINLDPNFNKKVEVCHVSRARKVELTLLLKKQISIFAKKSDCAVIGGTGHFLPPGFRGLSTSRSHFGFCRCWQPGKTYEVSEVVRVEDIVRNRRGEGRWDRRVPGGFLTKGREGTFFWRAACSAAVCSPASWWAALACSYLLGGGRRRSEQMRERRWIRFQEINLAL